MSQKSTSPSPEQGAYLSIFTYLFLTAMKIGGGIFWHSQALLADGLNNFTDIVSSLLILIGLKLAKKPVDENHPYGHWKFETIASLMTSFIMFFIGIEVLRSAYQSLIQPQGHVPNTLTGLIGLVSGGIMLGVYFYNKSLAERTHSLGLKASAKDNLSDALTSFMTAFAVWTASWGFAWLDTLMAFVVGCIILSTAWEVFKESSFALSDGFDAEELTDYRPVILDHPEIIAIKEMKCRRYGSNIYMDLTIVVDQDLTVAASHAITEDIERELMDQHAIQFVDIHVEPGKKNKE